MAKDEEMEFTCKICELGFVENDPKCCNGHYYVECNCCGYCNEYICDDCLVKCKHMMYFQDYVCHACFADFKEEGLENYNYEEDENGEEIIYYYEE